MGKTIAIKYLGKLKCELEHMESGTKMITDAPKDNNGEGSSFSPTDMLSAALASCYLTIIGIAARSYDIDINGTQVEVEKVMADNPRRVGKVVIRMKMPETNYTQQDKERITRAGQSCPVSRSLDPNMVIDFQIIW